MDKIEIEVSQEELERIRRNKKGIERRFFDVEGLETTLLILKHRFLLEQEERLGRKLEEMTAHYRELVEFQTRAGEDREFFLKLRRELSEENRTLREKLGEGR